MKINDFIEMKGRLTLRLHDREGRLLGEFGADNEIVLTGREMVANLFAKVPTASISHIAVGTGTADVALTDNKLGTEVHRQTIRTINPATDITTTPDNRKKVMVSTELDFGVPASAFNGKALTEAAMFNGDGATPAANIMYNRVKFQPVTKTDQFKLTLVWEVLF